MLSREEIIQAVLLQLSPEERTRCAVFLDTRVRSAGERLAVGPDVVRPAGAAQMAFVDLKPGANWGHPVAYFLFAVDTGQAERVDAQFPPFDGDPPPHFVEVHRSGGRWQ